MANLVRNTSGLYSIRFRLGNQRFNRSLETTSEKEAKEEKARIEKTIRLVMEGEKELPDNATPEQVWILLRSGGKRTDKVKLAAAVSLEKVAEEVFRQLARRGHAEDRADAREEPQAAPAGVHAAV